MPALSPATRTRLVRLLALALLAALASCRPKPTPVTGATFDKLSPAMQEKVRAQLAGQPPETFQQIVQQACASSAFANCVCCAPETLADCNPNNWDCCASVVFPPNDGGECAFSPPGICMCQAPG